MWKVIIKSVNGTLHEAEYLDSNKEFTLSHQNGNLATFILRKGTYIHIDTHACGNRELFLGCIYEINGSWFDFTKKNPPVLTLCATYAKYIP